MATRATSRVFSFRTDETTLKMLNELKEKEEKRTGYKITYSQLFSKIIDEMSVILSIKPGKKNDSSK